MPRARTQFGSASCADIASVLAVLIQAMPAMKQPGTATQISGTRATSAVLAACTSVP